jgi:hypothetical protein
VSDRHAIKRPLTIHGLKQLFWIQAAGALTFRLPISPEIPTSFSSTPRIVTCIQVPADGIDLIVALKATGGCELSAA